MLKTIQMGSWLVFPDNNKLKFQDEEHYIEPLAMEVLEYFLNHPQRVVSRNELIESVWQGRVVGDHSVYRIINKLRQILSKDSQQEYIKTIRKKGYQLVCDVRLLEPIDMLEDEPAINLDTQSDNEASTSFGDSTSNEQQSDNCGDTVNVEQQKSQKIWQRTLSWGLVSLVVIFLFAFLIKVFYYFSINSYKSSTPLITLDGSIRDPSFSPDGQLIAFSYRKSIEEDWDIYVESLKDGRLYQITDDETDELKPSWAPDGSKVAILRYDNKRCMIDVVAIPLLASTTFNSKNHEATTLIQCSGVLQHNDVEWGKAGRYLYFTSAISKISPLQVFRLTISTGKTEQLTNYTQGETRGALGIRLSPDNTKLAVLKDVNWRNSRIDLLDLTNNKIETVRNLVGWNRYFDWSTDSNTLIYNRNSTEIDAYNISIGVEKNIAKSLEAISFPVHSPAKNELAVVTGRKVVNIVTEPLEDNLPNGKSPLTIISSSSIDNYAEYANTSDRIAFVSRRTGEPQIWLKNIDGSEKQLTHFESNFDIRRLRWSPEDRYILFIHNQFIYQLSVDSLKLKVLYKAQPGESIEGESWSHDGQSILFSSNKDGDWQIYKRSLFADEIKLGVEQITEKGGYAAFESEGGLGIFYLKYHTAGLWFKSYGTEDESRIIDNIDVFSWNSIYLRKSNIYYLSNDYPKMSVYRYDLNKNKAFFIQNYYGSPWLLSVSYNADKLLYQRHTQTESSMVLLKP